MKQMTAICLALALVFGALANKQGLVVLHRRQRDYGHQSSRGQ